MIGRVGEKETGTPLLKPISKMSLFRLLRSCLPIQAEPYLHFSMCQVSLPDLANKTRRREGGRFKLIQRYLTQGFFEIIFMEFNKKIVDWWRQ